MIILIIIIILNFLIIIIIILLITMLTILLTTISLKNTIPSKHYLQFLSIKKHLVLIRKKKLKHIKLLIIHFIIIIIIIIIYSSQGTVGNIRWSPTANSNMIHAHGILQIALKTSFVLCQPTNAAALRDKCVTPLVIYSTTR